MTNETKFEEREMEAAITRALEDRTHVMFAMPADFAARVTRSLPPIQEARKPVYAGRTVAMVAAMVLMIVLFVLAPRSHPSFANIAFDVEILVIAQVAGIAYWLTGKRTV